MALTARDFRLYDDLWWEADIVLPSWKGFKNQMRAHVLEPDAEAVAGRICYVFTPEGRETEPLRDDDVALLNWLPEHEGDVAHALLEGLWQEYPSLRAMYGCNEEEVEGMPALASKEGFRELIELHSVNVHPISKQGLPYLGFEFDCS